MAVRLDHTKAVIPSPTPLLIESIAHVLHDTTGIRPLFFQSTGWENASTEVRTDWEILAKQAYTVICQFGLNIPTS